MLGGHWERSGSHWVELEFGVGVLVMAGLLGTTVCVGMDGRPTFALGAIGEVTGGFANGGKPKVLG